MLSRRSFLQRTSSVLAATWALSSVADDTHILRTISYNILAFRGYPRNADTRRALDENVSRHPEITAEAISKFMPTIITLQEGPAEPLVKRFAETLGMHYVWFTGGWEGNDRYPGGFPGALITAYPITESESRPAAGSPNSGQMFTRHIGRAKLNTPFGPLHVISAHFHASDHDVRMREATAIIEMIDALGKNGPVLLQGDLNHKPDDPEYKLWVEAGLVDIGQQQGIGNESTFSSTRPASRIDYIWATPDLAKNAVKAGVLNTPPFRPIPDDPKSYALSDHMPVMAEFNMEI